MADARKKKLRALDKPFDLQTLATVQRKLPRGASSLPKEAALHAQKVRLTHGVAHAVAEKGYAATTVADITAQAGVSRTTFYELFKDKEACYLFGLRSASATHLRLVTTSYTAQDHPASQMVKSIHAYVDVMELDKAFSKAFLGDTQGISPAVEALMDDLRGHFAKTIQDWLQSARQQFPDIAEPSALRYELLVAALWAFIRTRVRIGQSKQADEMRDLISFVFTTLGLNGWAKRALTDTKNWGSPLK